MPVAKVDARSFNYAKQVDGYFRLSLSRQSTPRPASLSPPPVDAPDAPSSPDDSTNLWKDLTTNQDAVSSYIICLIAKLISLDSGQGCRSLPDVYKEITEMQVDISKYRQWSNKEKSLQTTNKVKALSIQHAILATIHFLKQFYGYTHSIQLRNMYLRWNLARNYTIDNSAIADPFEIKTMTSFSVAASKDVIRDALPLSSCSSNFTFGEEEEKMIRELIQECHLCHYRSFFGTLPPENSKLLNYGAVASSLSYVRLKDSVTRNPSLLSFAISHVSTLLQSIQAYDYGEKETLLPLLLMLKEFLTISVDVDHSGIYKILGPFYMWPAYHAETVKNMLDMLQLEKKVKGN
jgi:hypothetical protein